MSSTACRTEACGYSIDPSESRVSTQSPSRQTTQAAQLCALAVKPRTAERLTNLLAMLCIVGWRVSWLRMVNRATPEGPAEVALTRTEIEILDRMAEPTTGPPTRRAISHYLVAIAKLGGYLARAKDPPPGNMALWRGPSRLNDIHTGFDLNRKLVGN